jgi:hypothetical protein
MPARRFVLQLRKESHVRRAKPGHICPQSLHRHSLRGGGSTVIGKIPGLTRDRSASEAAQLSGQFEIDPVQMITSRICFRFFRTAQTLGPAADDERQKGQREE